MKNIIHVLFYYHTFYFFAIPCGTLGFILALSIGITPDGQGMVDGVKYGLAALKVRFLSGVSLTALVLMCTYF